MQSYISNKFHVGKHHFKMFYYINDKLQTDAYPSTIKSL